MNYQDSNLGFAWTRNCPYVGCALCFLLWLIAFALGLILGAIYYEIIYPALAAIIAFAASIAAITIAILIYCRKRRC